MDTGTKKEMISAIADAKQESGEGCGLELGVVYEMMRRDPSYAWSWHCNLAMAYVDAGGDHTTGNKAAATFMRMLTGIDTSKLPEYAINPEIKTPQMLIQEKDAAYRERNYLVATLARQFPSGIRNTEIEGWDPEWHGCVFIDLPSGQISYHYHDSERWMFQDLPAYDKPYDGHDKEMVHQRLRDVFDTKNPCGTTVSQIGLGVSGFADSFLKTAPYVPRNTMLFVTRIPKGMSPELAAALKNIFETRVERLTGLISGVDYHTDHTGKFVAIPRLPDSVYIEFKEIYGQAIRTAFTAWSDEFVIGCTPQDLLDDQKELGLELMIVEPDPTMTCVVQAWCLKGTHMPSTGIYEHSRDVNVVRSDSVTGSVQLLGKFEVGPEHTAEACRLLQALNSSAGVHTEIC